MKVAYFGLPLGALLLARDGHELVSVAICRHQCLGLRRARRVFGERLRVLPRTDDARLLERMADAELLVSWFWTRKLPMSLVDARPLGGFGVHPSLLPRHRGPDPYFWAIEAGDPVTGVTAHRLAREYDTGAILGKKELAIDPAWNAWTLAKRLDRPSLALLREVTRAFAEGRPPAEVPQDEGRATDAPEPDDELAAIDPERPLAAVLRRIRALAPAPGAYLPIGDDEVTIVAAEAFPRPPKNLEPGDLAVVRGTAVLAVGDGAIALRRGEVGGVEIGADDLARLVRAATVR